VNPGYLDIVYVELRIEYSTVRVIFKLRESVPRRPYVPQHRAIWYNIFFGTHTRGGGEVYHPHMERHDIVVDYWAYAGNWEGSWTSGFGQSEPYINPLHPVNYYIRGDEVVIEFPLDYLPCTSELDWYANTFDNTRGYDIIDDVPDYGHITLLGLCPPP